MKIFNQLRLLVWKNFTLRKRQPLRNFLEIAWPLVIFFILVAVRTRRHPESKASRYYRPRALPSAGLLPFMQSFFCDYRGGYLLYSDGTTYNNLPDVQNSRFAKFVEDALPLIENGTVRDRILRLNTDYQNYLRDQNLWNQLYQMYQNNTNITRNAFRSFIRDPTAFQNYLQNQIGIKPEIVQQLMTAKLNQDQVQRLMALASTLSGNYSSLMQMIIGSGLNSLPFPNASPQGQWLAWLIQNMQIVQALSQGQSLTAAQIRKIACDDSSPVAIDNIVQVSQGNLSDVRTALCGLSDSKLQNLTAELRKQIIIPRTPSSLNTTMLLEQARVLQNLTGDLQNLYQDMLALQPLEKVVTDYLSLMQLASQGADLNELICNGRYKSFGTNVTTSSGSSSTFGLQQAMGSLFGNRQSNTQQTQRNTTSRPWRGYDNCSFKIQAYPEYLDKLKNKTFAMKLSFKDKCAMIDPYKRIDCGWPGMSPSQCYQLGCCFDSSIKGPHYCFYEPKKAQCGCLLGTALKTTSGASDRTNQPSYDRGFIQLSQLFLRGQILYTPDNPLTRKIIKNIQAELSDIGLLKDFAVWWLNNSDTIRASLQDVPLIYRGLMQNNNNSTRAAQQWRTFLQSQLRASNSTLADQLERLPNNTAIMAFLNSQNGTMNISNVMDNVDAMFRDAVAVYDCLDHDYFVGYPDEESLVLRATNTSTTPVIASFVFENVDGNSMPKHVKYKIRQDIDYTPRTDRIRSWYWKPGPRDGFTSNGYLNFGFVFLQDLIDRAVMSMMFNETVNEPGIYVQQFPYPCYIRDRFVWYIGGSMPLLMTLAWVYSVAMIIKGIVYEKEKKLKEVMKVMGLGRTVHWIAWFINSSFMMLITIVFLVLTMRFGRILTNSNPFIVFLFLVVFMVSTIMMCFLISVFFSRANVAAACGGIIFFITYLPYSIVRWFEAYMSTSEKALSCLSSTTAFGLACSYFARYEEQGTGIQWDNLYSSPLEGDGFSLGYALTMMMVDSVLYGVLTWYLEAVMPGQFGIPKPWYFPVQKSYWFPKKASNSNQTPYQHNSTSNGTRSQQWVSNGLGQAPDMHEIAFKGDENDQTDKETPIEAEPTHLPLGVSIKDLVKIYKSGNKLAVDGLNLNLYENQITSFLGHNGAGKTTTMSILTGLYPPTHGTAVISGMDIRTDIDLVRKSLGMCPQYNVLFDQLTVEDHLWFYSSLKGMEKSKIPDEIEKFLKDIGLENKRHELACNLSGGMKRKLSVGMAFIAGSKVVILDEPTAGVDPYARRGIWDLLLKYKPGRTVLLSTHHMDEADVLGDRIAIISQGKLQCCGSSLFLKGHYGNGYYLTLTKKSPGERPTTAGTLRDVKLHLEDISESASSDEGVFLDSGDASEKGSLASSASGSDETDGHCSADSVSSFIKKHIPTAQLVEHVGSELTYVLPTEAAKEGKFQDMFEDLDRNLGKLRVGSYGVSDTTLEEVFLKVAEEAVDENADLFAAEVPKRRFSFRHQLFSRGKVRDSLNDKIELLDNMEEENPDNRANDPADDAVDGSYNVDGKSSGMKLLFRQFWSLVIKRFHHTRRNRKAFLSQIILPAIFVCIAMIVAQIRPFYEMPAIKLSTKMFQDSVPSEQYMMFADDDANDAYSNSLTDIFLNYPGLGTACMDGSCPKVPINFKGPITGPITNTPNCSCSTGISICPAGAGGPKPRQWTSYSGDILQNVTGRYIPELLLKTHDQYIRKRYGGITFGDNIPNLPSSIRESQDPVVKRMISYRNTKAWYDNKGYHALPTYVNVLSNNILRNKAKMKGLNPTEYGISTFNHPMNYTKEQLNDQTFIKQAVDVLVAICVVFALSFVPASFVVFLVNERATKAKHLHMVSGVRPYIYWTANYFWDMCSYLIPAIICVLIFLAFNDESYTSAMNFPPTFLLLLLYGWAVTPLMYPASYIFSVPSTAYIVMICANLFIGINCTLATFILEMFQDDQELIDINNSLKAIFLIFPNYCLGRGLIDLAKNQFMDIFSRFGQNLVKDPFSWDITGRNIMAMIIQGFVFFAINVLIEYRFFIKQRPVKNVVNTLSEEDDDVKQERRRVVSGTGSSTDAMRLINLTKVFKVRSKVNVAVNQLCVGVSKGECFGLLGVNGAGKTTTFKMLTGDLPVTSGEAYVNGYSVLSEIHDAHQTMGYCPQFDALDELLTAKEHLYLYARLRGVPEAQIQKVVMSLIARMNLRQYQDVCAGKYSGGNKRKLSTAIALVGNPNIVFMDEPTTGMDPKARRFLWNIITSIVKEGRTVILTSHSMEECEALCNRVAIMVNGQFKCLGSPQHLKNKYGDGYTVVLRVAGPNPKTEQVSEFIKTVFPNAILKDQHLNMLEYQLPSQGLSVANVFGQLEANRKIFNIEDYSVSQTTLDQVFINFAKDQTDGIDDTRPKRLVANNIELPTMRYTQLVDGNILQQSVDV